jgi:hypothetical protein
MPPLVPDDELEVNEMKHDEQEQLVEEWGVSIIEEAESSWFEDTYEDDEEEHINESEAVEYPYGTEFEYPEQLQPGARRNKRC